MINSYPLFEILEHIHKRYFEVPVLCFSYIGFLRDTVGGLLGSDGDIVLSLMIVFLHWESEWGVGMIVIPGLRFLGWVFLFLVFLSLLWILGK